MFNLVEIDKLYTYSEGFTPVEPYVFATQIKILGNKMLKEYINIRSNK